MTGLGDYSTEELQSKLEEYQEWGWSVHEQAVKDELESREDLSTEGLSGSPAEVKAETLYQYIQTASDYEEAGDKDTFFEMVNEVNQSLEEMSGEVNQRFSEKVNSDWE